jgi:hypothetical protein
MGAPFSGGRFALGGKTFPGQPGFFIEFVVRIAVSAD